MIETERFYFLNNPHTGSRTCKKIFKSLGYEFNNHYGHHIPPDKIPDDKPKVAIVRETIDWLASWYADYHLNETFEEWLERFEFPFAWERSNKLDIYEEVVDYYFKYEDGLEAMFNTLGYEVGTLPVIGKNKYKPDITEYEDLIVDKFLNDWTLYDKVLGGYKTWPKEGNIIATDMVGGGLNLDLLKGYIKSQYCYWEYPETSCGAMIPGDIHSFKYCPFCSKEIKK